MWRKCCTVLFVLLSVGLVASSETVFRTLGGWDMPPAYNGNPFAPGGVGAANDYIYGYLFFNNVISGSFEPWLATSFEETPDSLVVHLRNDLTWEDGVPFTSRDVYTSFYVGGAVSTWKEVWKYVDRIETPDDYTVVFHWAPEKSILAKAFIFDKWIRAPYHIYGRWLDEAVTIVTLRKTIWEKEAAGEDTTSLEAALDAVFGPFRESLRAYKPERPIGVGPFKLAKVTADEMVLVKRPDTPWAKTIQFDEIRVGRFTTNELAWAAFRAGEVDIEKPATPEDVVASLIAAQPNLRHIPVPDFASFALVFNQERYPFSEKAFRQALAYVIDRDKVRTIALRYGSTVKYPCGLLPSSLEQWTRPEFRTQLNSYPVDLAKAEELLEGLGMYKDSSDYWHLPDGALLEFEITAREGYTDWIMAADEIARQLTDFGIKTTTRIVKGELFGPTLSGKDYDMTIEFGVFAKFHPVQGYTRLYWPTGWIARISGAPLQCVGPDGEPLDLKALTDELMATPDKSAQMDLIEKLAWATNEYLPVLEFLEKRAQFLILDGVRAIGWPEYSPHPTEPNVWVPGPEMLDKFGYNWRFATVMWMAEGTLVPVR